MSKLPKCWYENDDCFAYKGGGCALLSSYFQEVIGKVYIPMTTKFKGRKDCPFHKSVEDAGGTYDELCDKYPV